jgi:acetyl esterase/lipase
MMKRSTSEIHPELRHFANRIPSLSVTSGNLWWWRFLSNLVGVPKPPQDVLVKNIFIPGRENTRIRLRVYKPASMQGPVPGMVWFHGGGYVFGKPEMNDRSCIQFVREAGIVVVSVDYRCAPRHPFPAALEEGYAALKWVHSRGRQVGVDNRIAVGGASAGGGLAAALAQLAHDRKEIPIQGQLLVYPMLDDRTVGRADMEPGFLTWGQASNRFGWESYLGACCGSENFPAYAVPARRADLSGLPPAWIGVGTMDLFHDENVAYAQRLKEYGVECELYIVPGAFHGFDVVAPKAAVVQDFQRCQTAALKKYLFSAERKFTAVDMIPGKGYRVVKPFTDFDGAVHDSGESWVFTGKNFLPYDDGLTVYVKRDHRDHTFRMQWRDEAQGDVISNFSDYVDEE